MAFNPAAYKAPVAKKLPNVIQLEQCRRKDEVILTMCSYCVVNMIESFVNQKIKQSIIDVECITFGS